MAFSDASHLNLLDGYSSAEDFMIILVGENRNRCPLAWEAKKIQWVVKNTLVVETLAASDAAVMSYCLKSVLSEIVSCG